MIATAIRLTLTPDLTPEVTLTLADSRQVVAQRVAEWQGVLEKGKQLDVSIQQQKKLRSLDANAYCFVLCQKIAEVIGSTKELVYRKMIKDVGQFEILPIKNEAVAAWISRWESRGLGWMSEVMEPSKIDGYTKVISYYGSSVYDTREMSILINEIVSVCKELNIETATPAELARMMGEWGR